jgi:hypothetical protein
LLLGLRHQEADFLSDAGDDIKIDSFFFIIFAPFSSYSFSFSAFPPPSLSPLLCSSQAVGMMTTEFLI